jgi:2-polyprenyl-3-methyl-5-hydroxy-6-metoxy-1,4-benzoquinol methylase
MSDRAGHEIKHGEWLASRDAERSWGWGTQAGRTRALRRASMIVAGAQLGPAAHVLEVGCGTGMFTEIFARSGCSLVAVDISGALLELARARSLPTNRVRFLRKRFEDCGAEGPFDAVIGSSVLHHLAMDEAMPCMYRLLKPGGVISFAEPNLLNPQVFAERKFRKLFPYVSPDETAFVHWQLARLLREQGFDQIEIVPFDWLHPQVPDRLVGVVSSIGGLFERTPVLRAFAGSLYIRARRPAASPEGTAPR